jgi:branched-chain amino acid transport system ATP-binding protein
MLRLEGVEAGYGDSRVLFGMDLHIAPGEVVTLLGRNGMGKTTTVRAVLGLVRVHAGSIQLDGEPVGRLPTHAIAARGIGLVPEGRQVFPTLSVRENLLATAANRSGGSAVWNLDRVYAMFPRLAERDRHYGNQLSGGEQQMLAIGRALMTNPKLLILDEATEGLAPLVREEIWAVLESLRGGRESILLIDKNLDALLRLANRHYLMERGRVVWSGSSAALADRPELGDRYLGI